jgi:hypothetical protein
MTEISLLGCGWLGLPLAQKLINSRFVVKGSTTSEAKMGILENAGIAPYRITLSANAVDGDIGAFLSSEILIIDIPPKTSEGFFPDKIKTLLPLIVQSSIKKVLLVSSISVYGETSGVVDENTIPKPDSENGKQLHEAENLLVKNPDFKTTVLRFGGLIGGDRHPLKYLSGKENDNPNASINLIHIEDCIGVICKIIALDKWGQTYNAVSPFHPTRKEYYIRKAGEQNLPMPTFTDGGHEGKIVRADKVITDLVYTFEKPFL